MTLLLPGHNFLTGESEKLDRIAPQIISLGEHTVLGA